MSSVKKVKEIVRLQIKAGEATPAPPVGPVLGSRGVNLMNFCKQFNTTTDQISLLEKGTLVTVVLTIFHDRTFTFVVKSPPTSYLIKKYSNVTKGCSQLHRQSVIVSMEDIENIIRIKKSDLTAFSYLSAFKTVCGTIKSMGFSVQDL